GGLDRLGHDAVDERIDPEAILGPAAKAAAEPPALREIEDDRLELVAVGDDELAGQQGQRRGSSAKARVEQARQLGGEGAWHGALGGVAGLEVIAAIPGVRDDPAHLVDEARLDLVPLAIGVEAGADRGDLDPSIDDGAC